MAKCKICGKWKIFAKWTDGICDNCTKSKGQLTAPPASAGACEQEHKALAEPDPIEPTDAQEANSVESSTITPPVSTQKRAAAKKVGPKVYRVTGVAHYLDNLLRLAMDDDDYKMTKKELIDSGLVGQRIWKYFFLDTKAEIVPEPDNPYDPRAIKVLVGREHVGYIKAGSCAHLLKVIKENRIKCISCEISGGPYKYIDEDYDTDRGREVYTMEKGDASYSVVLSIDEE